MPNRPWWRRVGSRVIRKLQLPAEAALRAALAAALRHGREQRFVHRLDAVLLVSLGRSCYEVAQWLGDDPRTVERWVHAVAGAGVEGLRGQPRGGRGGCLTPAQRQQLALELAAAPGAAGHPQPRWTGKLLARHLQRSYGVCISVRQCQRLLERTAGWPKGPPRPPGHAAIVPASVRR